MSVLIFFQKHWIKFLVCFLIAFTNMAIYNSMPDGSWTAAYSYSNGAFIGGATVFFIGLLSLVGNHGTFDLASYMFLRRRLENGKKEDYYEYSSRKAQEHAKDRLCFLPYLIVGILYILFALVMLFIARSGK